MAGSKASRRCPASGTGRRREQAIQDERERQAVWEREAAQPFAEQSAEIPDPAIEPERERIPVDCAEDRDEEIQQAIKAERERQHNWEQSIEADQDNERDVSFGID